MWQSWAEKTYITVSLDRKTYSTVRLDRKDLQCGKSGQKILTVWSGWSEETYSAATRGRTETCSVARLDRKNIYNPATRDRKDLQCGKAGPNELTVR